MFTPDYSHHIKVLEDIDKERKRRRQMDKKELLKGIGELNKALAGKRMKTKQELAIDEVMVLTNGLNHAIKEAHKAGLIVDVLIDDDELIHCEIIDVNKVITEK